MPGISIGVGFPSGGDSDDDDRRRREIQEQRRRREMQEEQRRRDAERQRALQRHREEVERQRLAEEQRARKEQERLMYLQHEEANRRMQEEYNRHRAAAENERRRTPQLEEEQRLRRHFAANNTALRTAVLATTMAYPGMYVPLPRGQRGQSEYQEQDEQPVIRPMTSGELRELRERERRREERARAKLQDWLRGWSGYDIKPSRPVPHPRYDPPEAICDNLARLVDDLFPPAPVVPPPSTGGSRGRRKGKDRRQPVPVVPEPTRGVPPGLFENQPDVGFEKLSTLVGQISNLAKKAEGYGTVSTTLFSFP